MSVNPILEEIHQIRAQIMANHGDNLSTYFRAELVRLKASGHPVVQIQQRTIRCIGTSLRDVSTIDQSHRPVLWSPRE